MTIVGGAVAPVIMGYIADTTGSMAIAFLIPFMLWGDWNVCCNKWNHFDWYLKNVKE